MHFGFMVSLKITSYWLIFLAEKNYEMIYHLSADTARQIRRGRDTIPKCIEYVKFIYNST